ncbi:MAG TPA: zinc ribbon domain-containing protein [Smithellaceae bacterium]|nr:zinc ribbon domain-containing protein [Smithellaceae bacterium]
MPTYEYECTSCGLHFEKHQSINDQSLQRCIKCNAPVKRMVSGGSGFLLKSSGRKQSYRNEICSLEETGKTCCGADHCCGKTTCGSE